MPNEFVARNGIIALNNSIITGSLNVTQGVTASLFGTASWASNSLTSSNIQGGAANYIPLWNTATSLSSSTLYQSGENVAINQTTVGAKLDIANSSNGSTNNIFQRWRYVPNNATFYLDLKQTVTTGVVRYNFSMVNDGYAYNDVLVLDRGSVGIGTTSPAQPLQVEGTNGIGIGANGGAVYPVLRRESSTGGFTISSYNTSTLAYTENLRVQSTGNVGIGTTTPNAKLDVNGNAIITGSLTVTSTITAQTLVVQTVTSSVDFVTGSTRFGSTLSNTHQFTGSVGVTGSLTVNSNVLSVGGTNVGVGTTAPDSNLQVGSISTSGNRTIKITDSGYGLLLSGGGGLTSNYISSIGTTIPLYFLAGNSNDANYIFSSTGNVGVGLTNPTTKLHVSASTGGVLEVDGAGTAGANALYVSASGNVGLGTSNPTQRLEVSGSIKLTTGGYLYGDGSSAFLQLTNANGSKLAYGSNVYFEALAASANIRATSENINIFNNNGRITLSGSGAVGVGTTNPIAELHVSGSNTDSLLLIASPGAASALFVSGSGNTGIGTAAPTSLLHILGDQAAQLRVQGNGSNGGNITIDASNGYSMLNLQNTATTKWTIRNDGSNNRLSFLINGSGGTEAVTVLSSGNVGIGTPNPTEKLHISGGNVLVSNTAAINDANTTVLRLQAGSDVTLGALYLQTELRPSATGGNRRVEIYAGDNLAFRNITFPYANVGIGTTTPQQKLVVSNAGAEGLEFIPAASSNANHIQSYNRSTSAYNTIVTRASDYNIQIGTTSAMFISSSGNAGIGTTSPASKLDVSGEIRSTGNLTNFLLLERAINFGVYARWKRPDKEYILGLDISNNGGKDFSLYDTTASAFRLVVSDNGNIGIGTTSPNAKLDVNGNTIITGSLTVAPTAGNIELQVTSTGTKIGNIITDTNTITGSLGISGSTVIIGSLAVGTSSLGSTENTIVVGPSPAGGTGEGGQILLQAAGGSYTSASMIDNYQNRFRILKGTNASSDSEPFSLNLHSGQLTINKYTGSGAFTGTAAANLAVDSSGNVITVAAGGGGGSVTINNNVDNYLITATGTANTLNGEANLQFNGSAFTITGSLTVITGSSIEFQVTNTGVRIGNIISDIHTITGSLNISGSVTGSLFGTASYATQALSASWAPGGGGGSAPTAVTFNRVTGSYTFALTDAGKTIEVSGSTNTTYNLTVPPASTTNFADGTFIDVVLYGTGSIQFVTGSGVTFRSANSWAKLGTRYGAATIINISGDEWYLIGNLNA
jgi:hypothetical protein